MAASFILMLTEWVATFEGQSGQPWEAHPYTHFFRFFMERATSDHLTDFLCTVFLAQAQHILACTDWDLADLCFYLPRVSPDMHTWGCYIDVLLDKSKRSYWSYIGSATGDGGLWSRFKDYCRLPGINPIKHQALTLIASAVTTS